MGVFHEDIVLLRDEMMREMTDEQYLTWREKRYPELVADIHNALMNGNLDKEETDMYLALLILHPRYTPYLINSIVNKPLKEKSREDEDFLHEVASWSVMEIQFHVEYLVAMDDGNDFQVDDATYFDSHKKEIDRDPMYYEKMKAHDVYGFERMKTYFINNNYSW